MIGKSFFFKGIRLAFVRSLIFYTKNFQSIVCLATHLRIFASFVCPYIVCVSRKVVKTTSLDLRGFHFRLADRLAEIDTRSVSDDSSSTRITPQQHTEPRKNTGETFA